MVAVEFQGVAKEFRDIEYLLKWAFRDQRVEHYVANLRQGSVHAFGSLGSSITQTLELGTRVDGGSVGGKALGARCHDDAVTIYEAVMALPAEAWMLVIKHARNGSEPEWYPEGPGRYVQPLDRNGEPKRLWRDPDRRRGDLGLAPMVLEGLSPALVDDARAQFRLWWVAMAELVALVNPELQTYQAEMPRRPTQPWLFADREMAIAEALNHAS